MFPLIRKVFVFSVLFFGLLLLATPVSAMQPMAETEMEQVTAQYGFSEFVVDDANAQMRLNIEGEIYADIDRFGVNYDDSDLTNPADQDWYGVRLGEGEDEGEIDVQNNLEFKEFFLEAQFEKPVGAAENKLEYLAMGFNDVTGRISADVARADNPPADAVGFNSFSGYYNDPTNSREQYYRATLGDGYFTFTNDRAHMVLDARGMFEAGETKEPLPDDFEPGVYMDFGDAEFTEY